MWLFSRRFTARYEKGSPGPPGKIHIVFSISKSLYDEISVNAKEFLIQQVKKPDVVLKESLRVGKEVIIGFPNFAHIRARFQIFFRGRTPLTPSLPYQWYETPNLHFLSISDFRDYCQKQNIMIARTAYIGNDTKISILPNLVAQAGLFLISK